MNFGQAGNIFNSAQFGNTIFGNAQGGFYPQTGVDPQTALMMQNYAMMGMQTANPLAMQQMMSRLIVNNQGGAPLYNAGQ